MSTTIPVQMNQIRFGQQLEFRRREFLPAIRKTAFQDPEYYLL
jgi:hypothetical protein